MADQSQGISHWASMLDTATGIDVWGKNIANEIENRENDVSAQNMEEKLRKQGPRII